MPSREEGLPLALLESMACGCIPISTNVGGIPEVLQGTGAGWLIPCGDVDQLAASLDKGIARHAGMPNGDAENWPTTRDFKL